MKAPKWRWCRAGSQFKASEFAGFSHKWLPSLIRVTPGIPLTAPAKALRQQRWHSNDEIWWRDDASQRWSRFDGAARTAWKARFASGALQRL